MFKNKKRYYKPTVKFRRTSSWKLSRPRARRGVRFTKKTALIVFFSTSLIWFAYFFLASDNFAVKTINVTGTANIPAQDLQQIAWQSLGQRGNMFLVSTKQLETKILAKYAVDKLTIKRDWPFTVNIEVSEKQARLILRALLPPETKPVVDAAATTTEETLVKIEPSPEYYYMDVNGIVVAAADNISDSDLQTLPLVETTLPSQTRVKPGESILEREEVEYVLAVYDAIAKSSAAIKISYINVNRQASEEVVVATSEGWQISLSRKLPLDTQVKKLELALKEKIKDKRSSLQYVDLRVKDRVYYK